jgi:two-component system sensor histidine kinase RegB
MSSVRITLDELRRDYAGDDELDQPLGLLAGQVARMQAVLDRLGDSARGRGDRVGLPIAAQAWLARTLERWGLMWPHARVTLDLDAELDASQPMLADDPALEAILVVLLNNAAQASPDTVLLRARVLPQSLLLEVVDHGGGFDSGKTEGWGVGLELARATLERIGGSLEIGASEVGGVSARIRLPLASVEVA